MSEDLNGRLSKLEAKVENHSKQLDIQATKNDLQVEMNTLLKMQIESNEKQNVQMEKFAETLDRVDENLTNLNVSQQRLQSEVIQIGNRVEDIEKKADESKIDFAKLFKHILWTGLPTLIVAYLLYKFGIK
ncbi:hypothetical protein BAOM_3139 [Peribacillus asahii]|uniref:Uncharacterized protein n=1 Tax=Peribacillus asahii TaxID=228899 RepID=A0A3Q9RPE2_9BACI|nr:hypothetical protein [Peribacillus asahii]AZV43748.1 hypothetical protein BAOM_3139 [Peribacillus asahii]